MSLALVLLIVVLVLLLCGGGLWAGPRYGPALSWSPLFVLLCVVLVLWLLGVLPLHP